MSGSSERPDGVCLDAAPDAGPDAALAVAAPAAGVTPPASSPGVRPQRALSLLVIVLVAGVTLWLQPYFDEMHNPNALVRVYLTRALVDEGTVRIDGPLRRHGDLMDKSVREGHYYCDKAPGVSLLAVPVYAALRLVWSADALSNRTVIRVVRVLLCGLAVPLILWLGELWLAGLGVAPRRRAATLAALGSGSMLLPYSLDLFGHVPAALFVMATAYFLLAHVDEGRVPWRALSAGLAIGLAVLTEYPALVLVAVLVLGALAQRRDRVRAALAIVAGGLLPALIFFWYNLSAFGHPLKTGYSYIANPFFHEVHAKGLLGISLPTAQAVVGSLLSPARGIFFIAPWTLLALLGFALVRRQRRALALTLGSVALANILFVTSFEYWIGGWSVGQRHLTALMPLLAIGFGLGWEALASSTDRRRAQWVSSLCAIAAAVGVILVSAASLTLAGYPEEFVNPVVEVTASLWRQGLFPYTVGSLLGLPSRVAIVPAVVASVVLLLVVLHAAAASDEDPPIHAWRSTAIAAALVGAWLGLLPLAGEGGVVAQHHREWLVDTVWEPRDALPAKLADPIKMLPGLPSMGRVGPAVLRHLARQQATADRATQALELMSQARLMRSDEDSLGRGAP